MPHPPHAGGRGHLRGARAAGRAGLRLEDVLLDPAEAAALPVNGRESAVLVPLFERDGGWHAVFTRRRADLKRHAGEISFPGGRRDPGDADAVATALREADEEIGLRPDRVEVVGALPPVPTFVTDYAIYPVVGVIAPETEWTLQPEEVDAVLELPLAAVRDGYGRRRLVRRGIPFRTDTYLVGDDLIWGATARIVADLLERVRPLA